MSYIVIECQFAGVGIVWQYSDGKPMIIRIFLSSVKEMIKGLIARFHQDARSASCSAMDKIRNKIVTYLKGKPVAFSFDNIDLSQLSDFQKKVLLLVRKIPRGYVSTYGRLAKELGIPKGARAVGQALARNPFPIIIPCHRIIRSNSSLGGFTGGVKLKQKLLELEGMKFDASGKVVLKKLFFSH